MTIAFSSLSLTHFLFICLFNRKKAKTIIQNSIKTQSQNITTTSSFFRSSNITPLLPPPSSLLPFSSLNQTHQDAISIEIIPRPLFDKKHPSFINQVINQLTLTSRKPPSSPTENPPLPFPLSFLSKVPGYFVPPCLSASRYAILQTLKVRVKVMINVNVTPPSPPFFFWVPRVFERMMTRMTDDE